MQRNRKIKCKNNDPETRLTYIKQVNGFTYDRLPLNVANILCEGGDWCMVSTEKEGRKHCFINKNGDTVQKCTAGASFIPNNSDKASGIYKKYKKLPNSKYYSKSSKMRKVGGPIMEGEEELKLTRYHNLLDRRYHNLLDRLSIRKANKPISSPVVERSIESDILVPLKDKSLYNLLKTKIHTKIKVKEFIEKRVYLPIEKFYVHSIKETFEETAKMLLDPTNRTLISFNTYEVKYKLIPIV